MCNHKDVFCKPLLSVITPIYNCEGYIGDCVNSLLGQSFESIEFIFIEDCSSDRSFDCLNEALSKYPDKFDRIKILRHSENRGVAFSRSEGVSASVGEWIIFCDADDMVDTRAYELMYSVGREYASDIVICGYEIFGKGINSKVCNQGKGEIGADELFARICGLSRKTMHGALWNKMIRRCLLKDVIFPVGLNYCEDESALFQILMKQPKIYILDQALYKYRIRNNSLISLKDKTMDRQCALLIPFITGLKTNATQLQKDALDAKVIRLLYRLLKSKRLSLREFYKRYGEWYDKIELEKRFNILERIHLQCCLKGYLFSGGIIGFCNDSGYRLIKMFRKFKSLLETV